MNAVIQLSTRIETKNTLAVQTKITYHVDSLQDLIKDCTHAMQFHKNN